MATSRRNDYNMANFYGTLMKQRPMLYGYQFIVEFKQAGRGRN